MALDLFSIRGYEATSISQIADAVGLRKACRNNHIYFLWQAEGALCNWD